MSLAGREERIHTIVEVPFSDLEPRRLVVGEEIQVESASTRGVERFRGVISEVSVRTVRVDGAPPRYRVKFLLDIGTEGVARSFNLDEVQISYGQSVSEAGAPKALDACIYLG